MLALRVLFAVVNFRNGLTLFSIQRGSKPAPRRGSCVPSCAVASVTPLRPLVSLAELSVMKRKRGRPKGSTKKPSTEEELAESIVGPSEACPLAPEEGRSPAPSRLECAKCARKFSNKRQLRKHICIIVLNLGEDEGDAGNCCAALAVWVAGKELQPCGAASAGSVITWKWHILIPTSPLWESASVVVIVGSDPVWCLN